MKTKLYLICDRPDKSVGGVRAMPHSNSSVCVFLCTYCAPVCASVPSCVCVIVDITAARYHLSRCHNNASSGWWWCIICQTISARTWSASPKRLQTWFTAVLYGGCLLSPLEQPLDCWAVCLRRPSAGRSKTLAARSADYLYGGYSGG